MLLFLVLTLIQYQLGLSCHEEFINETIHYENLRCCNKRGGFYSEESIIKNATIICSDVDLITQISYTYKEQNYEQFLLVENSHIPTLHTMDFYKYPTVVKLHLSHLHIKTIQSGAFTGLTKLRELYLDNNELTELLPGVCNSLHRLEILNITNNRLHQIEIATIYGLVALTQLYARNNNLSNIENNFFGVLKHVEVVDFSNNPLTKFDFDNVTNLDTLLLDGTQITEMDVDLSHLTIKRFHLSSQISEVDFAHFPKTEELDLSNNKIVYVNNSEKIDTLSLNLRNNEIEEIAGPFGELSHFYLGHNNLHFFEKTIFQKPELLLVLDLSYNHFTNFSRNFFHDFASLTILQLQHNSLTDIDPIWFHNLSKLEVLDLSGNQIEELKFGTFDGLKALHTLNISANKLTDLHQYVFSLLTNLHNFYFDHNQISSLDVEDLGNHLKTLKVIALDHNSWRCEELVKIYKYLDNIFVKILPGNVRDVENFHGIACSRSENLQTSTKTEFSFQELVKNVKAAIGDGFKSSQMNQFFNADFKNSRFAQYFDQGYIQSGFFKYLNNLKFVLTKQETLNGTKTEKLTAVQTQPEESNSKIFVFGVVMQIIMSCILLFIVYLLLNFAKKIKSYNNIEASSQIELC